MAQTPPPPNKMAYVFLGNILAYISQISNFFKRWTFPKNQLFLYISYFTQSSMKTKIVISWSYIRNLEPNCQYSSCSSSYPEILAKYLSPPQYICRPLKTFACVSLRYRKRHGGWVAIVVVVCGKICGKMCGKIEKLSDGNKNWCVSRYGPRDYDSGDKRQKGKNTKRQKDTNTNRQKKKTGP